MKFLSSSSLSSDSDMEEPIAASKGSPESVDSGNTARPAPEELLPDGGIKGWTQVLACWLIYFNILGIMNSYGQFQTYYELNTLSNHPSSDISWIGSTQYCICYLTSVFTGPMLDAGYLRQLLAVGTTTTVVGLMLLSLCTEYWQIFLTQAVVVGIGCGCLLLPAAAMLPQWFPRNSSFAVGVSATGSSAGAVVIPIALNHLIPRIGFGWTIRIIGFMFLVLMLVASTMIRIRSRPPTKKRSLINLGELRDIPYALCCIAFFVASLGLYVFFYYIQLYAIDETSIDEGLAFYLLAILNAGSIFGRMIPAFAAIYYGPMNVQIVFGIMTGILSFCLLSIKNSTGVIVFSALYGFISGPFVSLPIVIINSVTADKSVMGTRFGMTCACFGLGVLLGEPVAGAILSHGQNWTGVVVWSGVTLLSSSLIVATARFLTTGKVLFVKA